MIEEKELEKCYCEMYRGMVEKDRALLSEVLDDSFVLVHMTGMRQSKLAFIQAVEDGTLNYYSADHRHIGVEISSGFAVLTGQSKVSAAVFGGGRHTWRLRLRLRLEKKEGVWKITEAVASTY